MRLLLAFAALLVAAPASAHVRLERSTPAAGAIVHAPLAEIRIVFSAAVEVRYTSIVLYAPSGGVVALDSLQADSASKGRAFFVSAPRLPEAGTYRLEWRTAGADGHVLTGSFTFIADTAAVEAAPDSTEPVDSATTPAASDPAAHEHHPAARPAGVFASQSPLHVLVRALQFAALLALIGAFVLRRLLRRGVLPATQQPAFDRRLRRYTAVVLSAFLLLLPVRLWLQSGALHGASGALDPYLLGSLLTGLEWGHAWLAQLVLAGIAALTFATPLLPLAELAALALAFTPPLLGHAAGMETGRNLVIAVHGVHVLGAALWLGTLTALFLVAFPALRRAAASDEALAAAASVHRFSPLALAAAATTVAAGLVLGWLHVGSLAHFTGTTYGRTLALKLAILAVVVLAGFLNWRRAGLRSASSPDLRGLRRRIALELLGATAVLLVTGVLVALPPP
jgi:copper transport protein